MALTRQMKRGGKVWIRIFPDKPITKKPAETRMGKGKGNPGGLGGGGEAGPGDVRDRGRDARIWRKKALALAAAKLPVQTRSSTREEAHEPMKADEMRELSAEELAARSSAELEEERFRLALPSARPSRSRIRCGSATIRRDIARLQTILRERARQA